ncbi:MAG: hypothetical protein HC803_02590 [Saprospiraceae bacterium]|nr:hypothetical protein [Saprospiraceae bacterium]
MKKSLFLFAIVVTISLVSCSSNEQTSAENEPASEEQIQQQFSAESLQIAEEPEFIIEAEYDPALAKQAEMNKRAKTEQTSPIALTSDDDDLQEDYDDLPSKVSRNKVTAYDYEVNRDDILSDTEYASKGGNKSKKPVLKQEYEALYFVVAGAYRDGAVATKKLKEIEKLGYKVELISFDNEFKTICIAKLEDSNQANMLAKSLQANKVDAYVVKRRK